MSLAKRITYLKGLAEGLGLGRDTKEEKILHVMIGILEDMTVELAELKEEIIALDDDINALSEGVEDLEDFLEDCEEEEHSHKHGCSAASHPTSNLGMTQPTMQVPMSEPPEQLEVKPLFYAVSCPRCSNEITIDEDVLALGEIDCPNCGERLEFDLEDED